MNCCSHNMEDIPIIWLCYIACLPPQMMIHEYIKDRVDYQLVASCMHLIDIVITVIVPRGGKD